jgi:hypothetical protein
MRAQIIPRAPLNLIFEPGLYMLLRFQKESCARKLRDQKRSLFNAFEIFDHTSPIQEGLPQGSPTPFGKSIGETGAPALRPEVQSLVRSPAMEVPEWRAQEHSYKCSKHVTFYGI